MSTAAKKLQALVDRLSAAQETTRTKLEAAQDAAAQPLPEAFNEAAARQALAAAVAADAVGDTDTAMVLRKAHEAERTATAKALASATAKRDAAQREADDLSRELFELEAQHEEARRLLTAEIAREGEKLHIAAQREYAVAVAALADARAKLAAALSLASATVEEPDGQSFAIANFHVLSGYSKVEPEGAVDDERGRFVFNAETMTDFARAHYQRLRADICGEGRSLFGRKAA